jgi:hypothetical protein
MGQLEAQTARSLRQGTGTGSRFNIFREAGRRSSDDLQPIREPRQPNHTDVVRVVAIQARRSGDRRGASETHTAFSFILLLTIGTMSVFHAIMGHTYGYAASMVSHREAFDWTSLAVYRAPLCPPLHQDPVQTPIHPPIKPPSRLHRPWPLHLDTCYQSIPQHNLHSASLARPPDRRHWPWPHTVALQSSYQVADRHMALDISGNSD